MYSTEGRFERDRFATEAQLQLTVEHVELSTQSPVHRSLVLLAGMAGRFVPKGVRSSETGGGGS